MSLHVHRLGNVETRPSFHDDTHIWPVGYRVREQFGSHSVSRSRFCPRDLCPSPSNGPVACSAMHCFQGMHIAQPEHSRAQSLPWLFLLPDRMPG